MALHVEERAAELRRLLTMPEVQAAMQERCEEEGHIYEGCCTVMFQVYLRCKWCGRAK